MRSLHYRLSKILEVDVVGIRTAGQEQRQRRHRPRQRRPLFILGTPVAGGLYGERPDLGYLYDDNLNFTTDFRTVYATVLEDWLGASSEAISGQRRLDTRPILSAL